MAALITPSELRSKAFQGSPFIYATEENSQIVRRESASGPITCWKQRAWVHGRDFELITCDR
jgi:hypothetical protein